MVSVKQRLAILISFLCVACFSVVGCDKMTFLGDYFPSLKKKSDVVSPKTESLVTTSTSSAASKDVLVKLNDWTLTVKEFNEKVAALKEVMGDFDDKDIENRKAILDELVRQQLLVGEAERKGLAKDKDVVAAIEEYRKTLLVQQLAKGLVDNIQVADKDVEDFYNDPNNQDLFRQPYQWRLREVVVADEARAKELLASLAQGADFAEIARANSITKTAANGGDTGLLLEFEDPKVQNMVLTLDVGETSGVFKGNQGFYIVRLEEQKGGDIEPLGNIKAEAQDYEQLKQYVLAMRRQKAVADYIDSLKTKANIVINENLLK